MIRLTRTIQTPTHRVEILRGIDLVIPRGQFVAIMGPSGSGKSTLLGLLAGLDNASSGQLLLDGVDITGLSEDRMAEVRGRKIGFVFQSFQLIPTLMQVSDQSRGLVRFRSELRAGPVDDVCGQAQASRDVDTA